jgi:hypothetical protein
MEAVRPPKRRLTYSITHGVASQEIRSLRKRNTCSAEEVGKEDEGSSHGN